MLFVVGLVVGFVMGLLTIAVLLNVAVGPDYQ